MALAILTVYRAAVMAFLGTGVVQPDGKIVAAGSAQVNAASANTRFTLVRYNPDGSLDSSFGTAGVVSTDFFGTENIATSVAIQADGRIVVAGRTHEGIGRRCSTSSRSHVSTAMARSTWASATEAR